MSSLPSYGRRKRILIISRVRYRNLNEQVSILNVRRTRRLRAPRSVVDHAGFPEWDSAPIRLNAAVLHKILPTEECDRF